MEMLARPRMVYSMTTIPSRLDGMKRTAAQVISNLKYCDAFYLNIPYISARGKSYDVPDNFLDFFHKDHKEKIIINRCIDVGPITKILPVLHKETHPQTLIVTLDDDIRIKDDISQILLDKHYEHPEACLSFSGFCVGTFPFNWQFAIANKTDLHVDWIQGVHSILYPRGLINLDRMLSWKPHIFKHDDHRINSFLASENIPRISINHSPCDYMYDDQSMKGTESISGSSEFIYQNIKLSHQMKKEGLYNKSYPSLWITSIMGLIVVAIGLAIVTVYANSFFKGQDLLFIGIFAVLLGTFLFVILTNTMLI